MKKIVLASSSPRRKALLEKIGLRFTVDASKVEEVIDGNFSPHEFAKRLSKAKAKDVAKRHRNAVIIAADTLVVFREKILGKPVTPQRAKEMLRILSGKPHLVITAFTILDTVNGKQITQTVKTKVFMKKLTNKEIDAYVATGEPLDKAGGYGIQERGAIFIEKIEGDFFNVVGLPLYALAKELQSFTTLS